MAFGEILRKKRTELGYTKEYISERTHLMVRIIDALEAENHKHIPAAIYGRGFIRQYCALLNIDPQPLLEDYARQTGSPHVKQVTHPTPQDLPSKPLDPIHTGARRTLPPKKETTEPVIKTHKHVESAEASFTSVPKPEVSIAVAPEPEPPAPAPLSLESDTLPFETPPAPAPAPEPAPSTGRAALLNHLEKPARPRKDVTAPRAPEPLRPRPIKGGNSIFGPQRPTPDPPSPQQGLFRLVGQKFAAVGTKIKGLFSGATRPKVERLNTSDEPLLNKQTFLRALTIFAILTILTLLVFAFRYVFRQSATAETENTLSGETPMGEFTIRPVKPPTPYFK